ncbi:hypothetical protein AAG570_003333 [Ranatra chinensis]|uniref:SET domain-containing protein n=1 Tax=Ranatra chinensis TaxID=642074 RepID=A0ABD0Y7K3_9HEMI
MDKGYEVRNLGQPKGVGLFATKTFEENDVIFEEKPIVSCQFAWNETYEYSACHHCLRPLESTEENLRRLTGNRALVLPLPDLCPTNKRTHVICDDCQVKFCCEECKNDSIRLYHRMLCEKFNPGVCQLKNAWMGMHYPPETATAMLIARLIAMVEQSDDKERMLASFLEFDHKLTEPEGLVVAKLLGQEGARNLGVLSEVIPSVFPAATHTKGLLTMDGLKTLFTLVGKNGQGIGTSVFAEWVKKVDEGDPETQASVEGFIASAYQAMEERVGSFLNCEGSGLYALQRCVNHDCDPSADVTFPHSDYTLALVARRKIAPGEEITTSYLDDCIMDRSRHTRNKALKEFYLFECKCNKCLEQADEPDVTSDDDDMISDLEEEEDSFS